MHVACQFLNPWEIWVKAKGGGCVRQEIPAEVNQLAIFAQ
jgi:hypothetical protein